MYLKKNLNASKLAEHPPSQGEILSKCLDGNIDVCRDKNSSSHLIGLSDGGSKHRTNS